MNRRIRIRTYGGVGAGSGRLDLATRLISQSGMKLIHMASKGRLRYAHRVLTRCLQLAAQQKMNHLPDDVINQAIESLRSMSH